MKICFSGHGEKLYQKLDYSPYYDGSPGQREIAGGVGTVRAIQAASSIADKTGTPASYIAYRNGSDSDEYLIVWGELKPVADCLKQIQSGGERLKKILQSSSEESSHSASADGNTTKGFHKKQKQRKAEEKRSLTIIRELETLEERIRLAVVNHITGKKVDRLIPSEVLKSFLDNWQKTNFHR